MCGRFALHSDMTAIQARFRVRGSTPASHAPRWNLRAGDLVPVIRAGRGGRREIVFLSWGFQLDYHLLDVSKGPATQIPGRNFRKAALLQSLFGSQRCIVPADAFYVSPDFAPKTKHAARPWAFALDDDALMGFAAVWTADPAGRSAGSVTLVGTSPNESVALLTDTMPAILFPENEREWLSAATDPYAAYNIIKPFPGELMRAWPVAHAADGPDALARVA
jgi:putative SOS response-associated peptidase YedK